MRVLVAVLSSLMRARTEHAMHRIPDAQVVGPARDARQAVELLGSAAPDLCLCDAQMYPDRYRLPCSPSRQGRCGAHLRVTMATCGWELGEPPFEIFDRSLASLASMPGGTRLKVDGR